MAKSKVAVIVVPRERFGGSEPTLGSIYANTSMPFELIYVDGGSPTHVRRYLQEQSRRRGFSVVRTDHYLTPNEARNLGFKQSDSEYVVFIDNDAVVEPGWLEKLVECADETGAWIVGPTCLIGDPDDQIIHVAGGEAHFTEIDGERHFFEKHSYAHRRLNEVRDELKRKACDFVEFHCMLIESDAFRRLGPLDEALLSAPEHIDICLQVRAAGGEVYYEPSSVMTYAKPRFLVAPSDIRFFLRRWSDDWTRSSLRHFQKKYGLRDDDSFLISQYRFVTLHRRLPLKPFTGPIRKVFGNAVGNFLNRHLDPFLLAITPNDRPRKLETGPFIWAQG